MSIVTTEIESIHGSAETQRMVFYRCQDSQGVFHKYGPIITSDPNFDPESVLATIGAKVGDSLAEAEARALLED